MRRKELISRHSGVFHLAASGYTSRYEFTKTIIDIMKEVSGIPNGWAGVKPITTDQFPLPARRPRWPVMSIEKIKRMLGIEMPRWDKQLRSFLKDHNRPVMTSGVPGEH